MDYGIFLNELEACKDKDIKTISFPESCAMTQIPFTFSWVFPELLEIINGIVR